jgi:division/cell wall cluster transcriptional repressor MraZ
MGNSVKVDQKGRLKIPATLLTTLNQHGTEFYVTSENGDSVRIYPMPVWNQVEKRLRRLSSRDRNNERLLALAKYFGSAVTVDKHGRLLIPMVLRRSAQMRGVVGGRARLLALSGSLEPYQVFEKTKKQSNYGSGRGFTERVHLCSEVTAAGAIEETG